MAENSAIEWTDHTFNHWRGCVEVHAGCDHCYARELAKRNPAALGKWGDSDSEDGGVRVVAAESYWKGPVKWNRDAEKAGVRARVFCASLADVFEDWQGPMVNAKGQRMLACNYCRRVAEGGSCCRCRMSEWATMNDVRARLFASIDATPWLDWQLVTKRPENVRRMWCSHVNTDGLPPSQLKRRNVWLLTSVSDQASADKQIPELLKCRDLVPVLGISAEPLLGPIDFTLSGRTIRDWDEDWRYDTLRGWEGGSRYDDSEPSSAKLDWVIVGGESGHHARPMHPDWARSIRDQCAAAGAPFFFKQWGEFAPSPDGGLPDHLPDSAGFYFDDPHPPHKTWRFGKKAAGRLLDGRGWSQFPGHISRPTQGEIDQGWCAGDGA